MWSVPGKFNVRERIGIPVGRRSLETGGGEQVILR